MSVHFNGHRPGLRFGAENPEVITGVDPWEDADASQPTEPPPAAPALRQGPDQDCFGKGAEERTLTQDAPWDD